MLSPLPALPKVFEMNRPSNEKLAEALEPPKVCGSWEPELVEDLERFAGVLRVDAECEFRRTGLIATHFLVYCTINPFSEQTEHVIVRIGLGPAGMNDRYKDLASELVQLTCRVGQATAVVHISEMWIFKADTKEERERLKAWRAEHNGYFAGCPGAVDVVGYWIETRTARAQHHAPIVHSEAERRHLGAWTQLPGPMAGRFTNFLTHTTPSGTEA